MIDDCQKLNFPERIIEDDLGEPIRECFLSYTEDVIPRNFESIGYVFKASGGWPVFRERLQKFRLAINEVFFPVYAREDLINDPYFLIEKKKFKEAKAGLSNLPEERRLFCEAKLKALDKW